MDRRAFIGAVAGGLLTAPIAGAQQAGKIPRVGVLAPGGPTSQPPPVQAFRQALGDLGYVEGQTIVLEWRWEQDNPDRYAALASDLVRLNVDVIVAGTTTSSLAAKRATSTIPVVMAATGLGDPVQLGLVRSLAHPGGNITGLSLQTYELTGKRLELLKEAIPGITRVALLWDPSPRGQALVREHEMAVRSLGLRLQSLEVRGPADFERAFQLASQGRAQALVMVQGPLYTVHSARISELAVRNRLPTISGETGYAQAGGLMNYGPNISDSWRHAATYVDKILKGAKPGDLPIEQPTKFELVINLKTAKVLGLTIPQSLLLRADQIIE